MIIFCNMLFLVNTQEGLCEYALVFCFLPEKGDKSLRIFSLVIEEANSIG